MNRFSGYRPTPQNLLFILFTHFIQPFLYVSDPSSLIFPYNIALWWMLCTIKDRTLTTAHFTLSKQYCAVQHTTTRETTQNTVAVCKETTGKEWLRLKFYWMNSIKKGRWFVNCERRRVRIRASLYNSMMGSFWLNERGRLVMMAKNCLIIIAVLYCVLTTTRHSWKYYCVDHKLW